MPDFDTGALTEYAKDLFKDGVIGAVGLIANDKFIASRITPYLGAAGKYVGPAEGFLAGLLYRWLGEKAGHPEIGRTAAASLFSYKLASAFSTGPLDPPATHGSIGAASRASPYSTLAPIMNSPSSIFGGALGA